MEECSLVGVLEIAVNATGRGFRNTGGLIIKPRYPGNHVPKFQAKLRVPKEDPTAHGNGLSRDSANAATTLPD